MTLEQVMQIVWPRDLDFAKQLRGENPATWQQRWIDGLDHNIGDAAAAAVALESFLALSDAP